MFTQVTLIVLLTQVTGCEEFPQGNFVSWEKKLPGLEVHEKVAHLMKEG